MKVIYKYKLIANNKAIIKMPKGSEIIKLDKQHDNYFIWAIVNPDNETIEREFMIFGTGHGIPENLKLTYIDSFQMQGGYIIFHVFEKKDKE